MMGAYEDEDANESHRDGDVVADDSEQNAREEKPFGYYVRYNALRASVFETHTQQLKEIERERKRNVRKKVDGWEKAEDGRADEATPLEHLEGPELPLDPRKHEHLCSQESAL
jgi:hypothetical protein